MSCNQLFKQHPVVDFIKCLACVQNATNTEVERLLKYSIDSVSEYTHKSVE